MQGLRGEGGVLPLELRKRMVTQYVLYATQACLSHETPKCAPGKGVDRTSIEDTVEFFLETAGVRKPAETPIVRMWVWQ